jgi:hypothetical protein
MIATPATRTRPPRLSRAGAPRTSRSSAGRVR